MTEKEGPGLWWQFLEFMGMTWPGRPPRTVPEAAPRCSACQNAMLRDARGAWQCPHHPAAEPAPTE